MAFDGAASVRAARRGRHRQRQGRILPDRHRRRRARGAVCSAAPSRRRPRRLMGVNSRAELAAAEAALQRRLRRAADGGGRDPGRARDGVPQRRHAGSAATAWSGRSSCSVPASRSATGVEIPAFCHLAGAHGRRPRRSSGRSRGCGPAPSSADGVHIGNFVEVKNVAARARASRPTTWPISATRRSAPSTNIGAGTITCNYDGFEKFRTAIGEGVFIGTNALAGGAGDGRRRRASSPPAASSPRTCRRTPWRSARGRQVIEARPRRGNGGRQRRGNAKNAAAKETAARQRR